MDENLSMKNGAAFMDKCLENALNEQRTAAHNAIDMDDWAKAQEILMIAKRNISLVEELRAKFTEFKASVESADEIIASGGIPTGESAPAKAEEKPAEPAPEGKPGGEELIKQLEELIMEFPFAMATCNDASDLGVKFTYDESETKSMKSPSTLSNGLWVDTAVSLDKVQELVNSIREYCKAHNS